MQVTIIGAGVAGLCCGVELAQRGVAVELLERGERLGIDSCSWCAGGMLSPWCERAEGAEPLIVQLGRESISLWRERHPRLSQRGTLVVAPGRDSAELRRFAERAGGGGQHCDREQIAALEPELAERFDRGLYFAEEAHLDPRAALPALAQRLIELGGRIRYGVSAAEGPPAAPHLIDCRGLAARSALPDLRGVRGEMLLVRSQELLISRPVRLLHPRAPLYVVPRGEGIYLIGATMLETDDSGPVTVRSALELLSAAYALHPAFGQARILEMSAQVRPAFPDNLPQIRRQGERLYLNGLYRHGFLLAPALAARVAEVLLHDRHYPELLHEDHRERRLA
jgi:glycine oxidase